MTRRSSRIAVPPALPRRVVSILSPLRYPGAKRRLSGYIVETLRLNGLRPKVFVEPFAGGASVALELLATNAVDKIALGEKDPLVASFWKVAFFDSEWLIKKVSTIQVTLKRWDYFRNQSFATDRERALACLFLNRTSFSGILATTAGPIGGRSQKSAYRLDCRFSVDMLIRRLEQVAKLRKHVLFVYSGDWRQTIHRVERLGLKGDDVFYYFDPPFYKKAARLYRHYFDEAGHTNLHKAVIGIEHPWLLSYDAAREIVKLYSSNGKHPARVEMLYSASGKGDLVRGRELIISNLDSFPRQRRLWSSMKEWRENRPLARSPSNGHGASVSANVTKIEPPRDRSTRSL